MSTSTKQNVCPPQLNNETASDSEEESKLITLKELEKIETLSENMIKEPEKAVEILEQSDELQKLNDLYDNLKNNLQQKSRTSKLWIQYMNYVYNLELFIFAERTGNWKLHIYEISKTINLFAATWHINYAKSARLHLQNMLELETTYPWVYKNFAELGFHTVRRTESFWAGLWTDLIIEQVLMRSLKSRGGLTAGRGITESVRRTWINSMHRRAGIHDALCTLTGMTIQTSEQHKDLTSSRVKRDNEDLQKLIQWFDTHEPFDGNEPLLKSLSSGITVADDSINCDDAEAVGMKIQQSLDNLVMNTAKIKRKERVKMLDMLKPGVTLHDEKVYIDPSILFSRLTAIVQKEDKVTKELFYELTQEPSALFKDGLMRNSQKSKLQHYILKSCSPVNSWHSNTCVVDGGALLHNVKWAPNKTYVDICGLYINYIRTNYGVYDIYIYCL